MSLALTILPLLLTLAAGYLLVVSNTIPRDQWAGVEALSFRLLIPAFLVRVIAGVELSGAALGPFALSLSATVIAGGLAVLALRALTPQSRLGNPGFTTLFQTTTRFNGFIALAAAELLRGPAGLALIAVAMAVLIPLINVTNIAIMALFGSGQASLGGVMRIIVRNPIVQGAVIGLALNFAGIALPQFLDQTLDLIGRAALGVGVLAVGAGTSLRRMARPGGTTLLGLLLRPGLALGLFLVIAALLGLPPEHRLIGALVFIAPTASNGYIIARQMGGDAPLYADIMTLQTLLTLLLLPLVALLLSP